MIVYHAVEFEKGAPRPHPWDRAEANEGHRYYDLKRDPALIPTVLEDFIPFGSHAAIQRFYALLRWLNVDSALETNDCAFLGPRANDTDHQFPFPIRCSGRVMLLFKKIEENTQNKSINWLCQALHDAMAKEHPTFTAGAVGISRLPVAYRDLPGLTPPQAGLGKEVMLSFFAYGQTDSTCMSALETVIDSIEVAARSSDSRIKAGEVDALYG